MGSNKTFKYKKQEHFKVFTPSRTYDYESSDVLSSVTEKSKILARCLGRGEKGDSKGTHRH